MKKARCKYGHRVAHKQNKLIRTVNALKSFNYDKAGVITASVAFVSYCLYMKVIG